MKNEEHSASNRLLNKFWSELPEKWAERTNWTARWSKYFMENRRSCTLLRKGRLVLVLNAWIKTALSKSEYKMNVEFYRQTPSPLFQKVLMVGISTQIVVEIKKSRETRTHRTEAKLGSHFQQAQKADHTDHTNTELRSHKHNGCQN